VQTSCGYGVPLLSIEPRDDETTPKPCLTDRPALLNWGTHVASSGKLAEYQANNNVRSLDGLRGLTSASTRSNVETFRLAAAAAVRAWLPERDACMLLAGVVVGVVATVAVVSERGGRLVSRLF